MRQLTCDMLKSPSHTYFFLEEWVMLKTLSQIVTHHRQKPETLPKTFLALRINHRNLLFPLIIPITQTL